MYPQAGGSWLRIQGEIVVPQYLALNLAAGFSLPRSSVANAVDSVQKLDRDRCHRRLPFCTPLNMVNGTAIESIVRYGFVSLFHGSKGFAKSLQMHTTKSLLMPICFQLCQQIRVGLNRRIVVEWNIE